MATCNLCQVSFPIGMEQTNSHNFMSKEIGTSGVIDFVVTNKKFAKKRTDIVKVLIVLEIHNYMVESEAFSTIISSIRTAI